MRDYFKYLILLLFLITAVVLIPLEMKLLGWILLGITVVLLLFCEKHFRNDMILVAVTLGLLGIADISTDLSYAHLITLGIPFTLVVVVPYYVTRKWYKEKTIQFPFHHGRNWYRSEILYILITALLAYLILPIYMKDTGSYRNWEVALDPKTLIFLFVACAAVGIWDELFFVSTLLALWKKHFPFTFANLAQAVVFTSFLYDLGFRSWAPFILYFFTLAQGYIFKKTHSLLYVITIHLVLDFILYLVLIHAHYPNILDIFIT